MRSLSKRGWPFRFYEHQTFLRTLATGTSADPVAPLRCSHVPPLSRTGIGRSDGFGCEIRPPCPYRENAQPCFCPIPAALGPQRHGRHSRSGRRIPVETSRDMSPGAPAARIEVKQGDPVSGPHRNSPQQTEGGSVNLPSEKDMGGHIDALELCESELTLLENDPDDRHAQSIVRYRTRLENWREALLDTAPVRKDPGQARIGPTLERVNRHSSA